MNILNSTFNYICKHLFLQGKKFHLKVKKKHENNLERQAKLLVLSQICFELFRRYVKKETKGGKNNSY